MSNETKIPLFRRFVIQNFPYIEQDFDALTDYQLASKVVEYLNMVIEQTNQSTEQVAVLTDSFNQLKDYVDHYFDNLDVQEEINNKLDAMVQDGTMASLIDPILTEFEAEIRAEVSTIGDVTDLETVNKNTVVAGVNCANENYSGLWRTKYGNGFKAIDLSQDIDFIKNNITIYKDNYNNTYSYFCDLNKHKNTGGSILYVDPLTDVPAGEQDGTEAKPYSKVSLAYNASSDGDTISLSDGFYDRTATGNFNLTKSINIVAKSGVKNKVFCSMSDTLSWTQNATYENVYQTTRSNIKFVIDIRNRNKDIFPMLTQTDSLENCAATLYSYYKSGSSVYVNIGEAVTNDKIAITLQVGASFRITNNESNVNVYFENITFLGGSAGFVSVTESDGYDCKFVAKGCNFYYASGDYDALPIQGADSILEDCKACYGGKDGFNYHAVNSIHCNSIEINCLASNNGLNRQTGTENGSTTHAGNKILRFGGVYFNNFGANVCDVGVDTVSINIECTSFDSVANSGSVKSDFNAQQAGTTMYIYNGHCKGSKSSYNLQSATDCVLEVYNTPYDSKGGNGTINIH